MRALGLGAGALVVAGVVVFLLWDGAAQAPAPEPSQAAVDLPSGGSAAPPRTAPAEASVEPAETGSDASSGDAPDDASSSVANVGETANVGDRSGGSAEPPKDTDAFRVRVERLRAEGTKTAYAELLREWRAGSLTREQERAIDAALASARGPQVDELNTAAGRLLLEPSVSAGQAKALASLLAGSGSEFAVGALIEASKRPRLEAQALAALATVAEPGALPVFARQINASAPAALLEAMTQSLRNMDTPKARDLEARIQALEH